MVNTRVWVGIAVVVALGVAGVLLVSAPKGLSREEFDALAEQFVHESALERIAAYKELYDRSTAEYVPDLIQLMEGARHLETRHRAARILGKVGDPRSVEALTRAVDINGIYWVRWAAAHALEDMGATQATLSLETAMLRDNNTYVRKRAAAALVALDPVGGVEAIRKARRFEQDAGVRLTFDWLEQHGAHKGTLVAPIAPGERTEGRHKGTRYAIYVPRSAETAARPPKLLILVHGTDGRGDHYLEMLREEAERRNLVLLVPWFDYPTFHHFDNLNLGSTGNGENRTDVRLLAIIRDLERAMKLDGGRFYIFGQSRGGEFVQKMAFAYPDRIIRAAACGAGSFIHPREETFFPYGIHPNPFAPDLEGSTYEAFLQTPIAIVMGTKETDHALKKASDFMETVRKYARMHGILHSIEYIPVEGGGHSGATNLPVAMRYLFPE